MSHWFHLGPFFLPPFICYVVAWVMENALLAPYYLQKAEYVTQPLIKCSTRENRPWTSPGQNTGAHLVDRDASESPQEYEHRR